MADFYRSVYGGMADGSLEVQRRPNNQRGNGFFGRIIKGSLAPIIRSVLPYLKDMALEGVGGLVNELKEGKSMKEAATNQIKRTASNLADEMATRVKRSVSQAGSGLRKKQWTAEKRKRTTKGQKKTKSESQRPKQRGLFPV